MTAGVCPRCNVTVIGGGTYCAVCRPIVAEIEEVMDLLADEIAVQEPGVRLALQHIYRLLELIV